jgi:hypothetical protein
VNTLASEERQLESEALTAPAHTWAGKRGARLVLTRHGALLERKPETDEWLRLGLHFDGDEAAMIARQRGYDHVGLDSAEGYIAPLTLALVETEGESVSAGPQGSGEPTREELVELAHQRNAYIDRRLASGDDLDKVIEGAARKYGGKIHSVRTSYGKHRKTQGKLTPWEEIAAAEAAQMEAVYAEIERRRDNGETLNDVTADIAKRIGRAPGGVRQTYQMWRQAQGFVGRRGAEPAPSKAEAAIAAAQARNGLAAVPDPEPAPARSAEVRSLLGVQVTTDDGHHAVEQLHDLQDTMVSAMRATLQAIPDAKRIIELQVEELLKRLDDIEAEGKRIQAAADALGVKLE